jgi:hypothetical protein
MFIEHQAQKSSLRSGGAEHRRYRSFIVVDTLRSAGAQVLISRLCL